MKQREFLNLSVEVVNEVTNLKTCSGIENYWQLKQLWHKKEMSTMKDFLCYYNNLDVEPFIQAITNMSQFYIENDIDLFKDAIGTPGIARKLLFRSRCKFPTS